VEGLKDGLARRMAEANVQVDWRRRLMPLANGWSGLDDFQSLPFPSGCGFDPSGCYHLLLAQADANSPLFTPACHLDLYCSYTCAFNLMTNNVASCYLLLLPPLDGQRHHILSIDQDLHLSPGSQCTQSLGSVHMYVHCSTLLAL
jgi:hypothetical protein